MFARLIAKLFAPATRTPIRNARRTRLNAESLEAREVPANFWWAGGYSANPTSAALHQNWVYQAFEDNPSTTQDETQRHYSLGPLPGNGDNVFFQGDPMLPNSTEVEPTYYDCVGFGLASGYTFESVAVGSVGQGWHYNKTVTLASGFKTNAFTMSSGKISQPGTTGYDITVNTNFTFQGGTLNSSGSLANVKLDSAEAYITPYGEGSVTLGSNLRPEDGTNLTISPGIVNLTNDARFESDASNITIPATSSTTPVVFTTQNVNKPNTFKNGGEFVVSQTLVSQPPLVIDGSKLKITDGVTAQYTGRVAGGNTASLTLAGANGQIAIENGSVLLLQNGAYLSGGKLSTLAKTGQLEATIDGSVTNAGADVVISDGSVPHAYGKLKIDGHVNFTGGTYRPVINAGVNDTADRWYSTGNFTIGGAAKLELGALNIPQTGPVAGGTWVIIESTNGTVAGSFGVNNVTWPQFLPNFFLDIDANPAKQYRVRWPAS